MNKLLTAYAANKTDKTRARLQAYILKHMMSMCLASADEVAYLRAEGFKTK
jgi:hypothetical protein